jgi:hypothetical protein
MPAARSKYVRSTAAYGRDWPTLVPPLHLEPGEVARIAADMELPETEPATAKDWAGEGEAPVHMAQPEPEDVTPAGRAAEAGSDEALAFPPDSLITDPAPATATDPADTTDPSADAASASSTSSGTTAAAASSDASGSASS